MTPTLSIETPRKSSIMIDGGARTVCMDRERVSLSALPTHRGWRVRASLRTFIDAETQRIDTYIWFVGERA